MKNNPNAIPGIHNYCDRWCERCSFTSRCNVYENTSDLSPEEMDMRNKAFWERLSKNFEEIIQMIHQNAAKRGIELTLTASEEDEYHEKQKRRKDVRKDHPLAKISWDYSVAALAWLKKIPVLDEKENELNQGLQLGILTKKDVVNQTSSLKDSLEIIQWYVHFIHVKLVRALSGKAEDDGWDTENGFQHDFDGSAKIALVAIERTMQAWINLMETFKSQEDSFLDFLSSLQKMKIMTEKEFPNAWKFIRPGFDD